MAPHSPVQYTHVVIMICGLHKCYEIRSNVKIMLLTPELYITSHLLVDSQIMTQDVISRKDTTG